MKKKLMYHYSDVILDKEIQPLQLRGVQTFRSLAGTPEIFKLRHEWDTVKPPIGYVTNVRFIGTPDPVLGVNHLHAPYLLVGDVVSEIDLKGEYPALCLKVFSYSEQDDGSRKILESSISYVCSAKALNVDETLEPFI